MTGRVKEQDFMLEALFSEMKIILARREQNFEVIRVNGDDLTWIESEQQEIGY